MFAARLLPVVLVALLASRADAVLTSSTLNPANSLATSRHLWFEANGVGTALCAGIDAALACPFGTQTKIGQTRTATFTLQNKDAAATYAIRVLDGTGPAGISTIVTVHFASNAAASVTLAPGASDVVDIDLKLRGSTAHGTYTGTVVISDAASGSSVAVPISVTYP